MKNVTKLFAIATLLVVGVLAAGCPTNIEYGSVNYDVSESIANAESTTGYAVCSGSIAFFGDIDLDCNALLFSEAKSANLYCEYADALGNIWSAFVLFNFPAGYIQDSCALRSEKPGQKPIGDGMKAAPIDASTIEWKRK